MNRVIAAAVQFQPRLLEVERNLAVARSLIFEAGGKGAQLIVLPELCISGGVLHTAREAAAASQTKDGYQTRVISEIASLVHSYVIFGYIELSEGKLYNSALLISPRGEILLNIRKKNLQGSDNLWATPGDTSVNGVAVTPFGRVGALICGDVTNTPRASAQLGMKDNFYKKGSVDTIALLTNWGSEYAYPDSSWVSLSESLGVNVIVSNRYGEERDITYKGGCCIISKNKELYTEGSYFDDDSIVGGYLIC